MQLKVLMGRDHLEDTNEDKRILLKYNLKEIGFEGVQQTDLSQNRAQLQVFLKIVMNHHKM
jgi:hypothetical protein